MAVNQTPEDWLHTWKVSWALFLGAAYITGLCVVFDQPDVLVIIVEGVVSLGLVISMIGLSIVSFKKNWVRRG